MPAPEDQLQGLVLIFETHATTVDNEMGLASGWHDVQLSTLGEEQAREIGLRHRESGLSAVFCSDLQRSWRSAEIAFAGQRIPIVRDARLRECDFGALTRRPVDEIDVLRSMTIATPFPGGESYEDVARRVGKFLAEVSRDRQDQKLLVIGHRATFYAFEHLLRGVPLKQAVEAQWRWQPGWIYKVRN